jgi:hypothetical protein
MKSNYFFVILIFSIASSLLIISANGIPYSLDSNESFSSLWHAFSINKFGIEASKGLADEVFSPLTTSHPFVHSHQGNFPRLFAWIIFELGARSAEAQIIVTTFTIGLASILMGYMLFERIANSNFAIILALVLMTDYILFAQWQVVTYRVWSGFFLFCELLLVSLYSDTLKLRWLLALYFSSLCLFYSELIFAVFVAITSFLLIVVISWSQKRKIFLVSTVIFVGALSGILIFFYQAILYLGYDNFLRDIQLTFGARNAYSSINDQIRQEIVNFYSQNGVIFWENFQNKSEFAGFKKFIQSFTYFDWQIHTPFFSGLLLGPIVAAFIGLIQIKKENNFRIHFPHPRPVILQNLNLIISYIFLSVIGFNLIFLLVKSTHLEILSTVTNIERVMFIAFSICFAILIHSYQDIISITKQVLFFLFLFFYVFMYSNFYDVRFEQLWLQIHNVRSSLVGGTLFFLSIFSSIEWIAISQSFRNLNDEKLNVMRIIRFLSVIITSYLFIYLLSPGYIYSGYLVRSAPFTVFISDIFVALGFYIIFRVMVINLEGIRTNNMLNVRTFKFALGSLALIMFSALWIQIQISYIKLLPANHYSFLKKLSEYPYKGKSFIVNNYAAPVAYFTMQWAYMDTNLKLIDNKLIGDNKYLWFADKKNNQSYKRPDYYLCMKPQTISTVLYKILYDKGLGSKQPGCLDENLIKKAMENRELKGLKLVDFDKEGPKKTGFVSWAIVKFDWNSDVGNEIHWK